MKKVIAIVLAAVMLLALAACGGSVDTSQLDEILTTLKDIQATLDSIDVAAPAAEAPAEEAPAEEPAEEAEAPAEIPADAETLDIGLLLHTTGGFAGVDTPNYNEFRAMVYYINENGGWQVGDKTYILNPVFADGQTDPNALRTAAISLVTAGVKFVVETNDFWVNSCADVFEDEGIMHASAYCTSTNAGYLVPENPMAFTGSNGTPGDMKVFFEAFQEFYPDVHTIAYANDDNGSNDATYALMSEIAETYGYEMVGNIAYPMDTTDYTQIAQQIVDTGADAFMGNGTPDAYGAILKAVRALGSDMVMGCMQAKPVTMIMEYAGEDASYNGFSMGVSSRPEDADSNTQIVNDLLEVIRTHDEFGGADAAATFDGAAANTLYIMLQMMQKAGSVDPADVAAAWEAGGEVESMYGPATVGGTETYGVENHAVGHPRPISIMDPEAEDGWYFAKWIEVDLP